MSALAQCDAFAFIYDQAGDPAPDILVVLKRVLDASGNPILLSPKTTVTDSAGSFHFTLPELSTAFISARATALWNCPEGRAFKVPPGPAGELVPDFSLPSSTLVQPPLVYVGDVLSIPKASETQDGYLAAADYVAFLAAAGADVGITSITAGTGLTGGTITDTGTIALATIPGVAGTYPNPSSITVNAQGQVIAITSGAPDTTPPVISGVNVASLAPTAASIAWVTNEPADSQVEYGTTTSYGSSTTLAPTAVTTHSVPLSGLTSNTLYHFRVKSRDTASNLTTSSDFTFTTPTAPDTTPPGISAVMATLVTETGVTITWTTDEVSDSQVEYGPTTGYGTSTPLDGAMVTSHTVPITGLTGSTLYHFRVKSHDASTNLGTSVDFTFTTLAPGSDVNLLDQIVSYWKMDVLTAGVTPDELGNNDFTLTTLGTGTGALATSGIGLGNEIGFAGAINTGTGATLACADNPTQHFTDSFSVAGWIAVHFNDGTQIHTVLAKGGSTEPHLAWDLWFNEYISQWEFVVYTDGTNATRVPAASSMAPVIGTHYFVCGVYDATANELRLSINNSTPVVAAFSGTVFNSSLQLNSGYPGTLLSNCAVDEIGLWSRALNADEITALYNGGAGKTHPFT
jgi:hypothetical protein